MPLNLANAFIGLTQYGDYTTPKNGDAVVQALMDLVTPDYTTTMRGFTDEMTPAGQVQLLLELTAMKAAMLGVAINGTKASKVMNPTGNNNEITWTAKAPGTPGNAITVVYVDSASNNVAFSIGVVGNAITVNLATDGASAPTSTAADIIAGVLASAAASNLVTVALTTTVDSPNTGLGVAAALSVQNLAGGAY